MAKIILFFITCSLYAEEVCQFNPYPPPLCGERLEQLANMGISLTFPKPKHLGSRSLSHFNWDIKTLYKWFELSPRPNQRVLLDDTHFQND